MQHNQNICPRCGTLNGPGQQFCSGCGNRLSYYEQQQTNYTQQLYSCPNCRYQVHYGDQFCNNCGTLFNWPEQQTPSPQYQQQQQRYYSYTEEKPRKKMNPWLIGILAFLGSSVLIVFLIFGTCLGLLGSIFQPSNNTQVNNPPSSSTPAYNPPSSTTNSNGEPDIPDTTPTTTIYSMHQDVSVSNQVIWNVTAVRDRGNLLSASESRYVPFGDDKITSGKFIEVTFEVENISAETESLPPTPKIVDSKNRTFNDAEGYWEWVPENKEFILPELQPNIRKEYIIIYELPSDATDLKLQVADFSFLSPKTALIDLGI